MKKLTFAETKAILTVGASICIEAHRFTFAEAKALVAAAKQGGSNLTFTGAEKFTFAELKAIGTAGKGYVTLS